MRIVPAVLKLQQLNVLRVIVTLLVLFDALLTPVQAPVFAQGDNCSAGSPLWDAYTVTVCITDPVDNTILKGEVSVTATVNVWGANPGVQKLLFYLDGKYLLTDYTPAYTFIIPTTKFIDGKRLLEVEAVFRDGFVSRRAAIDLTFNNGIEEIPVTGSTFTPRKGTTPAPGRPFVLAATGDGASGEPNADAVAGLIASWDPNMFLYLGDVYDKGTVTEFYNWYGTGTEHYSRLNAITNPIVGNHEYEGNQAPGYFDYWKNVPDYYSVNAAGWHIISLNSNGQFDQTAPGTQQFSWLVQQLEASSAVCTLVYFHHPVYNIGPEGESERMRQIWAFLAQHGVDVVLTGHDHDYQRWQPLNGQGLPDPNGVTQFVVGTGGHGIQDFIRTDPRVVAGFDRPPDAFGALRMELNPEGAAFQFVNIRGSVLDSGSIPCDSALRDNTPPATPSGLTATSNAATEVDLRWLSATDNVGVTGYDIYRDAKLLISTNAVTSYTDRTVSAGTSYQYQIRARDAAGKISGLSASATVAASQLLFSDGFESGNFSQWTDVTGLAIQRQDVQFGDFAVRGTSRDTPTHAYKQLSAPQGELYYRLSFKLLSQGSNTVFLQRFRTSRNGAILGVFISNTSKLGVRNDVTGTSTISSTFIAPNKWYELQTHIRINGSASELEIWLDGSRIGGLSSTEDLGTLPVGRIQLGDSSRGRIYDIVFDRVELSTEFIAPSAASEASSLPLSSDMLSTLIDTSLPTDR